MKPCSILVASFNSKYAIELCIESIIKRTDYPDYRIIILDSSPKDSKTRKFLRAQRNKNRIELLESEKPLSHGQALVRLMKYCKTKYACLMDSDCEVLAGDWLIILADLLKDKNDLGVARFKKGGLVPNFHWRVPIYWPAVMFLNMELYREFEGEDDWSQINTTLEEYKYKHIFKPEEIANTKIKLVNRDTAWRFTEKILFETGNKYKMYPIPPNFWKEKVRHYGGISRNHWRPEHPKIAPRVEAIRKSLARLRNE